MPSRIRAEAELGVLPPLPVGTAVGLVVPDGNACRYHAVGSAAPPIALRLGWGMHNVWLRDVERMFILTKRPDVFTDLPSAIAHVLQRPMSVHANPRGQEDDAYLLADGQSLRVAGLLRSRASLLDLVVERRAMPGGAHVRAYHFAPTNRNKGGRQLWP